MTAAPKLAPVPDPVAAPFLKWAGGKTQLLPYILPRLPEKIRTYYEPFIGGGAVFFALANEGRFESAILGDRNPALVEAYRTVKNRVEDLIEVLGGHQEHAKDEEYYYEMRASEPDDPVERVARLLFLNKTCFNGLYRVNRKGKFNVPFGRYKNPRVLNETRLRAASFALRNTTILNSDFENVALQAQKKDAVYFDPPYVPVSSSASFTAYDAHPFGQPEQERLAEVYRTLCRRGVTTLLSNSDCPATRELYAPFSIETVHASRAINSVASKRGKVTEVLLTGLKARKKPRAKGKHVA